MSTNKMRVHECIRGRMRACGVRSGRSMYKTMLKISSLPSQPLTYPRSGLTPISWYFTEGRFVKNINIIASDAFSHKAYFQKRSGLKTENR